MTNEHDVILKRIRCPYNQAILCGEYGKGKELDDFKGFDSRCDDCEVNND